MQHVTEENKDFATDEKYKMTVVYDISIHRLILQKPKCGTFLWSLKGSSTR